MANLYTMETRDLETGRHRTIYGHATINVIHDYLEAYLDRGNEVIIRPYGEVEAISETEGNQNV